MTDSPDERWANLIALENADSDTLPLSAPVFGLSEPDLAATFADRDRFARFVNVELTSRGLDGLQFLDDYWVAWRHRGLRARVTGEPVAEPAADLGAGAAAAFQDELAFWGQWSGDRSLPGRTAALQARVDAHVGGESLHPLAGELASIALADPSWHVRQAAAKASHRLGWVGAAPLLEALAGRPPATPTPDALRAIAAETSFGDAPQPDTYGAHAGDIAAAFFAVEALADFRDGRTTEAVVRMAIGAKPDARNRARLALRKVPIDESAPHLFWLALTGDRRERTDSETLLGALLSRTGQTDLRYHLVGRNPMRGKVEASFFWVLELLARCRTLPDWADLPAETGTLAWCRDRGTCLAVVGHALRTALDLDQVVHYEFSMKSAWDQIVDSLKSLWPFGGPKVATAVRRYLNCEFPSTSVLHKPHRLRVQLATDTNADDPKPAVDVPIPPDQTHTDLLVVVDAGDCHQSAACLPLRVPRDGPSDAIEFTITPHAIGPKTIEVSVYSGTDRIGYSCVRSTTVPAGDPGGPTERHDLDDLDLDAAGVDGPRAVIHVNWQPDGSLEYAVTDPAVAGPTHAPAGRSPKRVPEANVLEWVQKQSDIIREFLKSDLQTDAQLQGVMGSLAGVGATLHDQLIPAELAQRVATWPPGSVIAVATNEGWVPWELLAESAAADLWGERFQIVRVPRAPTGAAFPPPAGGPAGAGVPPAGGGKRVLVVVGDDIKRGTQEGYYSTARTFGTGVGGVQELVEKTVADVNAHAADADVVHFICHGRTAGAYFLSLGPNNWQRLLVGQVDALQLKPRSLVFANACASDRTELLLADLQNFGWAFYRRGARPFIGTLGPVPAAHANRFAEHFYRCYIDQRLPVGRAMREARRAARKEFRNPCWLFYCVYGSATATWSTTPPP